MKALLLALGILACCGGAMAQQAQPRASLLFHPQEVEAIDRLLAGRAASLAAAETSGRTGPPPVPPDIHMGALIYLRPNDWVIWINGVRRTPRDRLGELEIAAVTAERAEIVWRGDAAAGPLRIRLRPHQTFIGTTGEIFEGTITPAR